MAIKKKLRVFYGWVKLGKVRKKEGVNGSLKTALEINSIADKNHVSKRERNIISEKLKAAYLANHRDYKEPYGSLFSEFDFE